MAYVSPWWLIQLRNDLGLPLAGGKIYTYVSDTSIPKPVYYDSALTQPTPNPLILDSAGYCPQFFMEAGSYTFHVTDANNVVIATRNEILGAASSGGSTSAEYQIKIDGDDILPGFIYDKLQNSSTIIWDKTDNKIIANVTGNAIDSFKLKSTSADSSPDFIVNKIQNSDSISLSVVDNKLKADYIGSNKVQTSVSDTAGYLNTKFADSPTVTWANDGNVLSASVVDSGKVKIDSEDTSKYIEDSIKAGSGIVFTQTEDINGKQIHISTTNATSSGQIKTSVNDSLGYLPSKLVAGTGITLSANDNQIKIIAGTDSLAYISSVLPFTSAVRVSNTGLISVTSISLSAGTWDVEGNILGYISPITSSVNSPGINANINTSVAFVNDGYEAYAYHDRITGATRSSALSRRRYVLGSTTTIYLVAQCRFGEFNYCDFWGNITAKQVG